MLNAISALAVSVAAAPATPMPQLPQYVAGPEADEADAPLLSPCCSGVGSVVSLASLKLRLPVMHPLRQHTSIRVCAAW